MVQSGALVSRPMENSMPLAARMEPSKCGRTAKVRTDCGRRIGSKIPGRTRLDLGMRHQSGGVKVFSEVLTYPAIIWS